MYIKEDSGLEKPKQETEWKQHSRFSRSSWLQIQLRFVFLRKRMEFSLLSDHNPNEQLIPGYFRPQGDEFSRRRQGLNVGSEITHQPFRLAV